MLKNMPIANEAKTSLKLFCFSIISERATGFKSNRTYRVGQLK